MKTPKHISTENDKLLLVPMQYRRRLLELAHCELFSGTHSGTRKVLQRIETLFTFPRIRQVVAEHRKSRPVYQKLADKGTVDREWLSLIP